MSVLFILLMHLVNGAQFLNITPLFLSSNHFAASSSPAPVIVIVPFASMYAFHYFIMILALIYKWFAVFFNVNLNLYILLGT